jgi:protection of telomeres protein 1
MKQSTDKRPQVQRYQQDPLSLITNRQLSILLIYEASKIPRPPASAQPALRGHRTSDNMPMVNKAEDYISWMYQQMNKTSIPDVEVFEIRAAQSLHAKDKFSLLENVRQDRFYNVIVQIVRPPYDLGDKATIWVTDFTENGAFFDRSSDSLGDDLMDNTESVASGDPLGYTSRFRPVKPAVEPGQILGPHGKRCMQVTCYEPHATRVRDLATAGSWVLLSNLQVKYGHNGNNLEGFLREDRHVSHSRVQVQILNPKDDLGDIDPRLVNAIRRKRDYEKKQKTQPNQAGGQLDDHIGKRKRQSEPAESKPLNSKQKRRKERAEERKRAAEEAATASLNKQGRPCLVPLHPPCSNLRTVRCEHMNQPTTPIAKILETPIYKTTSMGQPLEIKMPFNCVKYRAAVRVIDFYPHELEAFASLRKVSEYDCLNDTGSGASSDSDIGPDDEVIWEWRFALRLQDAAKAPQQTSTWIMVDNLDAQLLLSLDACDLKSDPETLNKLRERLFLLWGNLEEIKTLKKKNEEERRKRIDQPPLDSSDVEGAVAKPSNKAPQQDGLALQNRPFSCCIHQYGVKVPEPNHLKADAGRGRSWKQMFGLFGTQIIDD